MNKHIAVFIPVYNEAETLHNVLSQVPSKIFKYLVTIVIVDDCSTDNSVEIASQFTQHIVKLESNSGVGVATKVGFEYISNIGIDFSYVLKFDGDGQHELHFIPQIVARLHEGNDIVICSRFHPLSNHAYTPVDRILLNCIFSDMVRKITGWKLTDVRSGYMGIKFEIIKAIHKCLSVQRYGIPMDILLQAWGVKKDAKVLEIPHPALYSHDISRKLKAKYQAEYQACKASRLQDAYQALLQVVQDMNIPREHILEMNGYKNY